MQVRKRAEDGIPTGAGSRFFICFSLRRNRNPESGMSGNSRKRLHGKGAQARQEPFPRAEIKGKPVFGDKMSTGNRARIAYFRAGPPRPGISHSRGLCFDILTFCQREKARPFADRPVARVGVSRCDPPPRCPAGFKKGEGHGLCPACGRSVLSSCKFQSDALGKCLPATLLRTVIAVLGRASDPWCWPIPDRWA